ncbi:MAG: SIMPL domain-containing protein [Acetatifactor sp.]|nr:SIMPL domain-containing protein [Acetatifactor sp.]
MENKKSNVLSALFIGIAVIASCCILAFAFLRYKVDSSRSITATGSASVDFEADVIVWRGSFSAYSGSSGEAYEEIKRQAALVEDYLKEKGLKSDEYVLSAVDIRERSQNYYDNYGNYMYSLVDGYELSQNVQVSSGNIDLVEDVSRDISKLLDQNVKLTSGAPEYYCTGLDSIKLDLIEKATENAKSRIDIMADKSGAGVGVLKNSNLGVFQITAKNSGTSYYSYDGYLDTSSRYKTASITVKLEYGIK